MEQEINNGVTDSGKILEEIRQEFDTIERGQEIVPVLIFTFNRPDYLDKCLQNFFKLVQFFVFYVRYQPKYGFPLIISQV